MTVSQQALPDKQEDLRIQLLGRFHVWVGAHEIEDAAWRRRKAAAIVKLLALAPQHRFHREQLMDLLWPDFEPQAAANNLRTALHAARRVLASPGVGASPRPEKCPRLAQRALYLQGNPLELCPAETVWVDVHAFETAATAARRDQDTAAYQAALALYTGNLLPEDRYEEWTLRRREALHSLYISLLIELAQLYKLRGSIDRPESLVLTEDDYEAFYRNRSSLTIVLQGYLACKTILFLGYDLSDPLFKRLYAEVTAPLDRYARRAYAFGETPPTACRWCERHGIEVVSADTAAFLEALSEQFAARARPAPVTVPRPVEGAVVPCPSDPTSCSTTTTPGTRRTFAGESGRRGTWSR